MWDLRRIDEGVVGIGDDRKAAAAGLAYEENNLARGKALAGILGFDQHMMLGTKLIEQTRIGGQAGTGDAIGDEGSAADEA